MNGSTPDLLQTLERIEEEARRTQRALEQGAAVNGRNGLRVIEEEAKDARARFAEEHAA